MKRKIIIVEVETPVSNDAAAYLAQLGLRERFSKILQIQVNDASQKAPGTRLTARKLASARRKRQERGKAKTTRKPKKSRGARLAQRKKA